MLIKNYNMLPESHPKLLEICKSHHYNMSSDDIMTYYNTYTRVYDEIWAEMTITERVSRIEIELIEWDELVANGRKMIQDGVAPTPWPITEFEIHTTSIRQGYEHRLTRLRMGMLK